MRIVIDLQGAQTGSRHRGIGRYTISLVKEIILNKGEHEVILALNSLFFDTIESLIADFDGLLPKENIKVWKGVGPVMEIEKKNKWRRETSEMIREYFFSTLMPDFILLTTLFEGFGDDFVASIKTFDKDIPVASILYDLIPLINTKEDLADTNVLAWYQNKVLHCQRADLLLSISESSRQEALEYLGFPKNKVVNISSAADSKFRVLQLSISEKKKLKIKFGLDKKYLMYSGATDHRKNHLRLIKAYSLLPMEVRCDHQLAFVGGMPDDHREKFLDHAIECGLKKGELVITGRVSDEDMIALYNLCKAFIFPSWHEGFGLPALEAMQCGRAVIASNTSSLPEVISYPNALFDPFDELSIKDKIKQVLLDAEFRSALEFHSLSQAEKFSWGMTARKAILSMENYYEQVRELKENDTAKVLKNIHSLETRLIENISKIPFAFSDSDLVETAKAISLNNEQNNKRQLFVDISELKQNDPKTGIQRVSRSILSHLLTSPPRGWVVEPVYATRDQNYRYARQFTRDFLDFESGSVVDEYIEYQENDVFLGLDLLHPSIVTFNRNQYQVLRKHGVKIYFVVYDILPILLPKYANEGVSAGHIEWMNIVSENDGAICISKNVADEVRVLMENNSRKTNMFKISWFHLGADIENSSPSKGFLEDSEFVLQQLSAQPSFLMVGTIEPRKGHAQTLAAFEELWSDGQKLNLVIVGKEGWLVDDLIKKLRKHPMLNQQLFWLEGISDEYLEKVYAASTCLIAASEGEGFGLPLIEAAQHRLPIIARDIPVFKEVAGEHAFYFNNDKNATTLVDVIKKWLVLYEGGQHPKADEMPWLTWEESAKQLVRQLGINNLESKEH